MEVQARHQQKLAVLVDADHASCDTKRKSMSCYHIHLECLIETRSVRQAMVALSKGESEFYAWNMGCAAGMLVMSCFEWCAVGPSDVDGRTRHPLRLIVCQRNDEEVWSGANQTHGYTTLVVARELGKGLFGPKRTDTSMNTVDVGTKYLSATTRRT